MQLLFLLVLLELLQLQLYCHHNCRHYLLEQPRLLLQLLPRLLPLPHTITTPTPLVLGHPALALQTLHDQARASPELRPLPPPPPPPLPRPPTGFPNQARTRRRRR